MNNLCIVCGTTIQVMCRKGTGICGEICEKKGNDGTGSYGGGSEPNSPGDLGTPQEAEPYLGESGLEHGRLVERAVAEA